MTTHKLHSNPFAGPLLSVALAALAGDAPAVPAAMPQMLATAPVTSNGAADTSSFDGVVQAVRQTAVAAQVPGAVVSLDVKAGDAVKAGQVLLRLDARAAEQTAAAGGAQLQAARAAQEDAAMMVPDPGQSPLEQVQSRELAEEIVTAVEALPLEQRGVFIMFAHAGLSLEEIAQVTGVTFETAKSRLRYAREKLRQSLAAERSAHV